MNARREASDALETTGMNRNVVIPLAAAIGLCASASSVRAHHSHGWIYDLCKSVTIEGQVGTVQWKNPHTWFDLTLNDGITYHVEWTSAIGLANRGVADSAKTALGIGERVVVTGHPIKDPA